MFIYKETPTGTIDGANTTFTLANNAYQIDDIILDGAIYLGSYTLVGATLVLSDAPTVSLRVDYHTTEPSVATPTGLETKTISAFRTELMQEFGLDEDNDNEGTSMEAVLKYIMEANAEFINYRAWTWRKKYKTQYILPDTTVTTAFDPGDTQAVLGNTSEWPSLGRFMCDYNLIAYSGNDGVNTLTLNQADIQRDHEAGERCLLLYQVPTDFNKIISMWVEDVPYYPEDTGMNTEPSAGRYWQLEVRTSDGDIKKYFAFPYHTSSKKIKFSYAQKSMITPDDPDYAYVEIPQPYWNYINFKVSARLYRHLEENALAKDHDALADKVLLKASVFDSKQHMGGRVPIRTKWDNPARRLGIGGRSSWGHSNR